MKKFSVGDENLTLSELRKICTTDTKSTENKTNIPTFGAISKRVQQERESELQPYVITPHKINYILPAYRTNEVNRDVYSEFDGSGENLKNIEPKLQISFKVPLNHDSMLVEGDDLYFGFTLEAWWQIYASNISRPNYQPEMFYLAPINWHPFGGNAIDALQTARGDNA